MRLMITSDFSDQRRYNVPFNLHISYLTMTPCIHFQIRTRRAAKGAEFVVPFSSRSQVVMKKSLNDTFFSFKKRYWVKKPTPKIKTLKHVTSDHWSLIFIFVFLTSIFSSNAGTSDVVSCWKSYFSRLSKFLSLVRTALFLISVQFWLPTLHWTDKI